MESKYALQFSVMYDVMRPHVGGEVQVRVLLLLHGVLQFVEVDATKH